MKKSVYILAVLAALCIVVPAQLSAAETETQWRQRLSFDDEMIEADITVEVRFGREVAARVVARYGLYENQKLMKYVNLVGRVLAMSTNRPELQFYFAVLNTDEINAFAAPGGYIFVTRGAVAKMQDEAELAGVLAHEIGHVVEKHVVKELKIKGTEDSAVSSFAGLIGGSSDSARVAFARAADQAMDMLFKNGYKREDETQADTDAVLFCALSGYEPAGLVRYFERINSIKGKQTEVLDRTHPPYADRIVWLNKTIAREGLDSGNFKNYKERFSGVWSN